MDIDVIYRREVFWIGASDSLAEAARRMRAHDVSSLMVNDEEKPVGIITERDLTRAIAAGDPPEQAIVADYMADQPITVASDTGVREAAAEMLETEVRHLPVGQDGEVVGMISLRDLLSVVVDDTCL
jgi:signal-transduction protein with cAMP-binding, CBS, and nucleotidyltransferase domain